MKQTNNTPKRTFASAVLLTLAASLHAQTIDFETFPNGSPISGGTAISNQFAAAFGVSFRFEDGSYPVIRRVGGKNGGKPSAFWGPPNDSTFNMPAPGQNIGTNFLTDNGSVDSPPPSAFIITYSQSVSAASGFIIDIDRAEAWDVQALTSSTQVVAQVHLQAGIELTGDGIATPWSFKRPAADISFVRIFFTGDTNVPSNQKVGLAFDNFSPATNLVSPQPAFLSLERVLNTNMVNLSITGTVSAVYRIDQASLLTTKNWTNLTSVVLPASPFTLTNISLTNAQIFYRTVGIE